MSENRQIKIFVLFEGVNFGGHQLMLYNIFRFLKKNKNLKLKGGYLFSESMELYDQLNLVFDPLINFNFHSRQKFKLILNPLKTISAILKILSTFKKLEINVLFSNSIYSFFLCSLAKFFNPNLIHYRISGGDLHRNEGFYHYNKILRFFLPLYRYTDLLFTTLHKKEYFDNLKIPYEKIVLDFNTIPCVDSNLFKPSKTSNTLQLKEKLKISSNCTVIGWVGRLEDDKEFMETLSVCRYLKKTYPDFKFRFLVIGNGSLENKLRFLAKENNLEKELIRIDSLSQKELVKYYSLIDFELLLDEDPQGGSHLREAMSCQRVVISVDGSSGIQKRLIENLKTGFLVNPENRIEEAGDLIYKNYDKKELLLKIGVNARQYVKKHSYQNLSNIILKNL